MEMPRPTDEHRLLDRLVGRWEGEERMHPSRWDPEGGIAHGRSDVRLALDGFAAVVDYAQERDGKVTFSGHGVYGWDAREGRFTLHWFDSFGMGAELFTGDFEGDVLTLTSRGAMGWARNTSDYSEPGIVRRTMELSPDGENWQMFFEGTYRRKP